MKTLRCFVFLAALAIGAIARPAAPDLNTTKGVGLSGTEWSIRRDIAPKLSAGRTTAQALAELVAEWKNPLTGLASDSIRFNVPFADSNFFKQVLGACKNADVAVLLAYFDYGAVGIENYLPEGWWTKLKTAFGDEATARFHAYQLVKGMPIVAGQEWILQKIREHKQTYSNYNICVWMEAGNSVENAVEYVFHNTVGEPTGTQVVDSSSYHGFTQYINVGGANPTARGKVEAALGITLPPDWVLVMNTYLFEGRMRQEWNVPRWLEGANHGYWSKTGDGRPYFGDCGLFRNVRAYTEYGLYEGELPGRWDLLNYPPSNAERLWYWPGNMASDALYKVQAVRTAMRQKKAQYVAQAQSMKQSWSVRRHEQRDASNVPSVPRTRISVPGRL